MKEQIEILDYFTLEWLFVHHQVMEKERRGLIHDLALSPGDHVLDVGCGPGLWSELFAERIAPTGKVAGIDNNGSYIQYAVEHIRNDRHADLISYKVADFRDIPYEKALFDMVFCGGCFHFVENYEAALEEVMRVTKPGGRITDKSFDGATLIFQPMDPVLQHRVLAATARGLSENPSSPPFDNYLGPKTYGLFKKAGLTDVTSNAYAFQKYSPLTHAEKTYIATNAAWYLETARPWLTEMEATAWQNCFDSGSDQYILDREDFYFYMVEIVTVGRMT